MFKRLINLIRSLFNSILVSWESANPHALLEAEKGNLRTQIARFNEGLAEQAGNVYKLTREVQQTLEDEKKLADRIRILLQAGDQNNAAKLALQLSKRQQEAAELRTRCLVAEEAFVRLEKTRDKAVADASARLEKLQSLVSQTEMINARNELLELAGAVNSSLTDSHQSLASTASIIEKSHQLALGRARVGRGEAERLQSDIELHESETRILENRALAEFIATNSIKPESFDRPNPVVSLVKPD